MEHTFRCNVLRCRRELVGQALVTICSHIFCADCARRQGLYPSSESSKRCPACGTELRKPDDIVLATLSLGEEYKTSVLSGLSPHVIMECVGRGLSFWAYQMIQEEQASPISVSQALATDLSSQCVPAISGQVRHGKAPGAKQTIPENS
ncbi:E3 ubiquitin-protein ligase CCNB1IP1 [Colletotrichum spinosum]|uniref:E3 ubiquitin-protein ligase CCNB1IP1 n=1 Tax=Colletotrichum spinosum TaxID=1347390 RepID=A0A4R8PSP0_9PEZI|nr:E3 ubiquitin-protein ligase CCNB1IP1 [Colletotrichum spinosum]